MKKLTRRAFTAAGILTALGVGGAFVASSNLLGCVYGPPSDYDPENNEIEDVYGPPPVDDDGYDPEQNEIESVYGPPEWFEGDEVEPVDDDTNEDDGYDPEENIPVAVYGPPGGW